MCKDDWKAITVTAGAMLLFAAVARTIFYAWNHAIFG